MIDSRSECYGIEDFRDVLVKTNALELLAQELAGKKVKGRIGTGSMSDPYGPVEAEYDLNGRALKIIARYGFAVHILTKSDLVRKDLPTLREMGRARASVSFTITTADDELASKLEPGAPPPTKRFAALGELAAAGVHTGVAMMPVLPYLTDDPGNVAAIVQATAQAGGSYIIPAFGMTMRDRQRAYYYAALDRLFPGLSDRYRRRFGERYQCPAGNALELEGLFHELCAGAGLEGRYSPPAERNQLGLWS